MTVLPWVNCSQTLTSYVIFWVIFKLEKSYVALLGDHIGTWISITLPRFQFWLLCLVAVWYWTSYLISWWLSFSSIKCGQSYYLHKESIRIHYYLDSYYYYCTSIIIFNKVWGLTAIVYKLRQKDITLWKLSILIPKEAIIIHPILYCLPVSF